MHMRRRRIPFATLIAASAALSSACSSLRPCVLYRCPELQVRNGKECREVFAVNGDKFAKTFSVRFRYSDGRPGEVIGTSYIIGPGDEQSLGCTPECDLGPCWYEIFDAKDAVPRPESR